MAAADLLGFFHAEVVASVCDKGIIFGERRLVEQQVDSLSSGELIALVLRINSGLSYGRSTYKIVPPPTWLFFLSSGSLPTNAYWIEKANLPLGLRARGSPQGIPLLSLRQPALNIL